MNPRRVHQLMRARFPAFNAIEHEWVNMHDGKAPRIKELSELLARSIDAPEVLIEVHRKLGALLPIGEAAAFIGTHIGEGRIRVADRDFSSFMVIEDCLAPSRRYARRWASCSRCLQPVRVHRSRVI